MNNNCKNIKLNKKCIGITGKTHQQDHYVMQNAKNV